MKSMEEWALVALEKERQKLRRQLNSVREKLQRCQNAPSEYFRRLRDAQDLIEDRTLDAKSRFDAIEKIVKTECVQLKKDMNMDLLKILNKKSEIEVELQEIERQIVKIQFTARHKTKLKNLPA